MMIYRVKFKIYHIGKEDEEGEKVFSSKTKMNKFVNYCLRNFAEVEIHNSLARPLGL